MRLLRLGLALLALAAPPSAWAQTPPPPAPEPPPPAPPPPEPAPLPEPAPSDETPPSVESTPPPESAPATEAEPETEHPPEPTPEPPSATRPEPNVAPAKAAEEGPPPFVRATQALTLEARLGFSWRPPSDGFDDETAFGSLIGLSFYLDLVDEFALGLEVDRTSLGSGSALSGLDSVDVDFAAVSALVGLRAYPYRSQLVDVYAGLHAGLGFQTLSATGTRSDGSLEPAAAYSCSGADGPGFELGGSVGARLMLTPRWGVAARVDATGRRLSGEAIDGCALGIGTTTSVSGSVGIGYDFDVAP